MKNNVYPCKPQFYYIKVGFEESTLYRYVFMTLHDTRLSAHCMSKLIKSVLKIRSLILIFWDRSSESVVPLMIFLLLLSSQFWIVYLYDFWGSCIRRDSAEKDGTKKQPLSFLELNIFCRRIIYSVFFKMHIQNFKYIPLLRKYCQLNRPMSAGEKKGPNFRANDNVLNFCKYRQNSKC